MKGEQSATQLERERQANLLKVAALGTEVPLERGGNQAI